ncbi:MAG: hypothetical protein GY856_43080, partial [bacterium]|nr:hypothetical protein [bacterium]
MRVQVREDGVTTPRQLFEGVREVEIRSKAGVVLVTPVVSGRDRTGQDPAARERSAEVEHKSGTAETLAERQYRLARQHPDDW